MLKRNECTMEEMEIKLLSFENHFFIEEKHLKKENIFFYTIQEASQYEDQYADGYFPCLNGTLVGIMEFYKGSGMCLLNADKVEKMTENEFEKMAKEYAQMKKDLELMEATFEAEKLRGLFMKNKHM